MDTLPLIVSVVLGFVFIGAGGTKLAGKAPHPEEFARYDLPGASATTARLLVGAVEVVAALLLLLGAITDSSSLAVIGAAIVIAAMAGALATHGKLGDPPPKYLPAGILLALAAIVVATA